MSYEITRCTAQIINRLYNHGNLDKAVLAGIRDATDFNSQRAQVIWPLMLAGLDKHWLSQNGHPTKAEIAVYTALRFYAIHQQGNEHCVYAPRQQNDDESAPGVPLFKSLATLRLRDDARTALDRRVKALLGTTNINSAINAMTHLVEILKKANAGTKIDYAQLAEDLYWYQFDYEQANRTRLRWGQQYYQVQTNITKLEGKTDD
ncbi:MAG: type I-E CRISPR-associated protein Cse2/CasB [Lactobacillus sp.]